MSSLRLATSTLRPSARTIVRTASQARPHSTSRVPPTHNNEPPPHTDTTASSWSRTIKQTIAELNELLTGRVESLNSNFDLQEGGPGTKSSPIPVPSVSEERVVGCACGDAHNVQWIVLRHGHVEECGSCGNHFELLLQDDVEDVTPATAASSAS